MAANTTPIFQLTYNVGTARLTGANTTRDLSSTTNSAICFTAGANGSRVDSVSFSSAQATPAASSAMVGRVFITDNTGANPRLLPGGEIALPTITPSNTVVGQTQTINFPSGLFIPTGVLLKVTISVSAGVQDNYDVIARGVDY